ncbi:MAG: hypothetical protein LBR27_11565 [Bifidobacteriaceae bacterium]|jgi:hypothetical protein|nr:hypothetical protein [Bifidobacteriaceae bacterium]
MSTPGYQPQPAPQPPAAPQGYYQQPPVASGAPAVSVNVSSFPGGLWTIILLGLGLVAFIVGLIVTFVADYNGVYFGGGMVTGGLVALGLGLHVAATGSIKK